MSFPKTPYIAWREQPDGTVRPRFQPGPGVRALGFRNADLKHDDGRWFTIDEARAFALARHAEIAGVRASGKKLRRPPRASRTVEDLLEDFLRSGKFARPREEGGYARKTYLDYRQKADVIIYKPQRTADRKAGKPRDKEEFAGAPARSITPTLISNDEAGGFFEYLRKRRGLSTARGAIMVLSAAYKWARKASHWQLTDNPCLKLDLPKAKPEPVTYTFEEVQALIRAGDHPAIAAYGVVDAIVLALFSGQRPSDVLAYDGAGTSDGATRLVQSKRGRRVEVLQLPPLTLRLAAMAARRETHKFTAPELVVNPNTGKGYTLSTFEHAFAELRDIAARGRADLGLAAAPTLAGKQFKHLRKTLLTWLKRAGARDNQFAAVSGHSLASLPQVMPHYYAPGAEEAGEAMTLLWSWMQKQGMTG